MNGKKTYTVCAFVLVVVIARYFEAIGSTEANAAITAGLALGLATLRHGVGDTGDKQWASGNPSSSSGQELTKP